MDLEFIERATSLYKGDVKKSLKESARRPSIIRGMKKFRKTEKYREACKKKYNQFKKACEGLNEEEWEKIREFRRNMPEGYEIDHIVPISKGGLHRIENLQYLTREQNASKGKGETYSNYYNDDFTCVLS